MSTNVVAGHSAVNIGVPPSSLYVGDLHPDVTESMLFEKFSKVGTVLSIRVCRDAVSRASLGYAYVNFQNRADAEKALETMNFDPMFGKSIRIMWSQRDPSTRRSGSGNVFIKNLSKHIDTKSMYDTFTMFGNILSCKVACDIGGNSKGYGFIHFETEEAASKAIEKVNGMLLEGRAVYVAKFLPKAARLREYGDVSSRFNNLYVKNFQDKLDDDKLKKLFEKFGPIDSAMVILHTEGEEKGESKGFGFVCFKSYEDAEKAVEEMNGFNLPGTDLNLTVCRVMKKSDRQEELKRRNDELKKERLQRYHGVNLYVKNLDDTVTEDVLREKFSAFGPVTSVKLMVEENERSRGFGFVCFEKPEDATKAVVEMNNKMIGTKPLYVALAQRKEDRRAQLATQYMQRMALFRMQNVPNVSGSVYTPASGGYFIPTALQNHRPPGFAQPMPSVYGNQIRNPAPRYPAGNNGYNNIHNAFPGGSHNRFQRPSMVGQNSRQPRMVQPQYPRPAPNQRGVNEPYQSQITVATLASAKPEDQKEMIGNQLYPLVDSLCLGAPKEIVQKITGMILDLEAADVLDMIDDKTLLESKVKEAMEVLNKAKESSA